MHKYIRIYKLIPASIIVFLACVKNGPTGSEEAGTATDVNSSIYGSILYEGEEYTNPVKVQLFMTGTDERAMAKIPAEPDPIKAVNTESGRYKFDSLAAGEYAIKIFFHDTVLIGEESAIKLEDKQAREVNIVVINIINQIFNIHIDSSKNVNINNIYIINEYMHEIGKGKYLLEIVEEEDQVVEIEIDEDGVRRKIEMKIIKNQDGTYSLIPVEDNVPIDITSETTVIPPQNGEPAEVPIEDEGISPIDTTIETTVIQSQNGDSPEEIKEEEKDPVNSAPIFSKIDSKSVYEHKNLSFTVSASDADGDNLAFSMLTPFISNAVFDSSTRTFSWTPTYDDAGNYVAKFEVTDNAKPPGRDTLVVNIFVVYLNGDSLVVRNLLDENGFSSVPVDTMCEYIGERIWSLYLDSNRINGQLSSLPAEIGNLTKLESLFLRFNKLTSLPDEIGNLINLNMLDIEYNHLSSLPSSIGKLAKLELLDVDENELTSLPNEIGNLVNLIGLSISQNQLISLPSSFGNLTKLKWLWAGGNELKSVPDEIGRLVNLTRLDIEYNQLSSLPSWIGKLAKLEALDVAGNELTSIPDEIGRLVNLTRLDIEDNQLSSLPSCIGRFAKLEALDVDGNELTSLPDEIGDLVNLTSLDISRNLLISLPSSFGNLTKLERLWAGRNELTSIPGEIGNLVNLTDLYIQENQLSSLPSEIVNLTKLKELYVNDNNLCNLSETVKTWIDTYSSSSNWESTQSCLPTPTP